MRALLSNCFEIRHSNVKFPRWELFSDYVGIRATNLLGARRHSIPVLGYSLSVPRVDAGFHLYREIMLSQVYAFSSCSSEPLIVDCGSNVGMSVLFFKKLFPGSRVIAFEPDPATFQFLDANVSENRLVNVTLHNKAVGAEDCDTEFYINAENPGDLGMSVIKQDHLPTAVPVRSVRLSSVIGQEQVDFLKLDVEGAETDVIDELDRHGALQRIREMVVEYHHHIAGRPETLSHILTVLGQNGFGYQLKGPDGNFREKESFQVVWIHAYAQN
jgi:FkbM family methyltransferase